jgi:hypothetical protein
VEQFMVVAVDLEGPEHLQDLMAQIMVVVEQQVLFLGLL